ncbi:MAG TPA: hypothetical protein DEP57_08695 [Selenomonas sp.]|nr:hypothetical protein [Selenomonas sp.]
MGKHKQQVSMSAFAQPNAYDDISKPAFDADYWKQLSVTGKDTVAPISSEERKKSDEGLKQIEKLYPKYHMEKVDISKLIPAKEKWNFFPKQDKTILTELMKNLVAYGQLSPALVWKQDDGSYMILGGHTRYQAFKALHDIFTSEEGNDPTMAERFSAMNCYVYEQDELDEAEARKIIIYDNIIRRDNTTSIKAQAVINMNRLELESRTARNPNEQRERIMTSIAKVMGTSEGSIKRLYQLRTLIAEFWPLVDGTAEDKITTQMARTFSLLPEDLQKYIYQNHLYRNKLSGESLKRLSMASTVEDVDNIYSTPRKYVITEKLEMNQEPPSDYRTIMFMASEQEFDIIKEGLMKIIENPNLSDKTRELIRNAIG